jgi:hypothetical protein
MLWGKSVRWARLRKLLPEYPPNSVDQGVDEFITRGLNIVAWVLVFFLAPETKEYTLEELDSICEFPMLDGCCQSRGTDLQQLASLCDNSSTTRWSTCTKSSSLGSSAKTLSSKTSTSTDGTLKECNCGQCCLSSSSYGDVTVQQLSEMKQNV